MNSNTRGTSSRLAGRMVMVSLIWLSSSSDALQPLRNAARAGQQRLEEITVAAAAGAPALQQVHLHEVHRIDIRVAQPDGALQRGLAIEEARGAFQPQHALARLVVLGADHGREPPQRLRHE